MKSKLVSIIIPAYNHESYIEDTINSILAQSYQNFELLVLDDSSTDKTYDILSSIKDERLLLKSNKQNIGTVRTLNELLTMAKGEYIAFCGSDDIWEPNKLEMQINFLEKNKAYNASFSQVKIIDENNHINKNPDFNEKIFNDESLNSENLLRRLFFQGNQLCQSSAVLTTESVKKIGKFDIKLRQLHDYDYWMRYLSLYNIHISTDKLVKYRRMTKGNESVSAAKPENFLRMQNELTFISINFIKNIERQLFYKKFQSDLIIKDKFDELHEICEKYFILEKWSERFSFNHIPSLLYLNQFINNLKLVDCLERDYKFSLNDFYDKTALKLITYPNEYYENFKILKDANEKLLNSKSWRITKPLRKLKKILN